MPRTPENLALGQLSSADLTTIYTSAADVNTNSSVLTFTNTTTTTLSIDVYHGDGVDYLQKTITLPAGSGREVVYYGFQQRVINAGQTLKIQADSASPFNFTFSGSEFEI